MGAGTFCKQCSKTRTLGQLGSQAYKGCHHCRFCEPSRHGAAAFARPHLKQMNANKQHQCRSSKAAASARSKAAKKRLEVDTGTQAELPRTLEAYWEERFRVATSTARKKKNKVFLDIFGGEGGVATRWRNQGYAVVYIDNEEGAHPEADLTSPTMHRIVAGWIRTGRVLGVHLGPPCNSWSIANRGKPGTNWERLRSKEHVMGLPVLMPKSRARVTIGNKILVGVLIIVRACIDSGILSSVENGKGSYLWKARSTLRLGPSNLI